MCKWKMAVVEFIVVGGGLGRNVDVVVKLYFVDSGGFWGLKLSSLHDVKSW